MMKSRRGVSLIEVMVAVTLLGLIATAHTAVTLRYSVRTRVAAIGVNRAAAISTAIDLYTTMPYANLSANTGCTTISSLSAYAHQRCVTLSNPTQAITRVQIIITPTNTAFRSETIRVDRSLPPAGSIFS